MFVSFLHFEVGEYWCVYLLPLSFTSKFNEAGTMSGFLPEIPKASYSALTCSRYFTRT